MNRFVGLVISVVMLTMLMIVIALKTCSDDVEAYSPFSYRDMLGN